jgi:hypothetical protein
MLWSSTGGMWLDLRSAWLALALGVTASILMLSLESARGDKQDLAEFEEGKACVCRFLCM